jgi:SSS family solute:Na+ symporter
MNARLVIFLYLGATLLIGILLRKKAGKNSVEFFLAGRNLSSLLLFFTMAATNFSAFTIFGFSGAGYRIGYGFYPVMGFGTGFMALSFVVIGRKILILSRVRGYLVPSDFVFDRYGSRFLKKLFSLVMVVFTLPYISLQAIASGRSLESLAGIPYLWGALLVTGFVVVYVILGGMRSIAWTDLFQGIMMLAFTLTAFSLIASRSGGFAPTHQRIAAEFPSLFSRPGGGDAMTPGIWIGYMALWFFADPMFPQLFQRFMAARDSKALDNTVVLYPLVTTFLFFLTVSIGVLGRGTFPGLEPGQSDTIFPLLLGRYAGQLLGALLLTGSIAALMSTMDSQLLTLTSMLAVDFIPLGRREVRGERIIIAALGAAGFLIALKPPLTILEFISNTTFNGLSVLAPTVLAGLYWKGANRYGAAASIIAGEAMVAAFYLGILSTPGLLPFIPIILTSGAVLVVVSLVTRFPASAPGTGNTGAGGSSVENTGLVYPVGPGALLKAAPFVALFFLSFDFWNWGKPPVLVLGLPLWVWYYIGLGLLLSGAYHLLLKHAPEPKPGLAGTGGADH